MTGCGGSIYPLLSDHGMPCSATTTLPTATPTRQGRPTIPARVMTTVMILQAFEGLSDREATDRLEVDLRWQAAAGVDTGAEAFHLTARSASAIACESRRGQASVRRHQGGGH